MAERTRDGSKNPLQDLAFFTALLLGFTMLTRASNYLPITSATYHLDAEHISFNVALSPAPAPRPVKLRPTYRVSSRCLVVSPGLLRIWLGERKAHSVGRYIRRTVFTTSSPYFISMSLLLALFAGNLSFISTSSVGHFPLLVITRWRRAIVRIHPCNSPNIIINPLGPVVEKIGSVNKKKRQ